MTLQTDLDAVLSGTDATPFDQLFDFSAAGMTHPVLHAGEGPAVVLMHELPGFVPQFWRLARWLVAAGYTVYAPALYDAPGTPVEEAREPKGMMAALGKVCISREIHIFARGGKDEGSPVTAWLRALARHVHGEAGGPGIGVIGLCLTGNFAWSLAGDPSVLAPVAAEPSMPFYAGKAGHGLLHMSEEEKAALKARGDQPVMALRFSGDPACRAARFEAIKGLLGEDRVIERVLPDEAKNPDGNPFPHAVLTKDLIQESGEPTYEAAREVLAFLKERLVA